MTTTVTTTVTWTPETLPRHIRINVFGTRYSTPCATQHSAWYDIEDYQTIAQVGSPDVIPFFPEEKIKFGITSTTENQVNVMSIFPTKQAVCDYLHYMMNQGCQVHIPLSYWFNITPGSALPT